MATFNKTMYIHDISTMADIDLNLGDFSDYYSVELQINWSGFDAADGVIAYLQRDSSTSAWDVPTGLSYTVAAASGSTTLQNGDAGSKYVGVRIAKNSNSAGTATIVVTAKTN